MYRLHIGERQAAQPHELRQDKNQPKKDDSFRKSEEESRGHGIQSNKLPSPAATNVLVIGPTQTGKSTFINRIRSLARTPGEHAPEGDRISSKTKTAKSYLLDVPLTTYKLIDPKSGKDVRLPASEKEMLDELWLEPDDEIVVPVDSVDPRLHLRIVDSPGLDDSHGNDFANIIEVLTLLNEMHAKSKGQARLNSIIFIMSIQTPFASTLGEMLAYYRKCMPNLFASIIVVNTNFTVKWWDQELSKERKKHKYSRHLAENVYTKILENRQQRFAEIFKFDPIHFLLDSKPTIDEETGEASAFEELMSRNGLSQILNAVSHREGMPINQMTPYKLDQMILIDDRCRERLIRVQLKWEAQCKILETRVSQARVKQMKAEDRVKGWASQIQREKEALAKIHNDTKYEIKVYPASRHFSAPLMFGGWLYRIGAEGTYRILEPDYPGFKVDATDSTNTWWTMQEWQNGGKEWVGSFKAKPGMIPQLTATSYTTNKQFHRHRIAELQESIANKEVDMITFEEHVASVRELGTSFEDENDENLSELKLLAKKLDAIKHLTDLLKRDEIPLEEVAFLNPAKVRYQKGAVNPGLVGNFEIVDLVGAYYPGLSYEIGEMLWQTE
ncbi:hypothetical protein MMC34_007911 [Xylographa carneopallida]|nr:hypothetical protein [Xylographa carneopallida]